MEPKNFDIHLYTIALKFLEADGFRLAGHYATTVIDPIEAELARIQNYPDAQAVIAKIQAM